MVTGALPVTVRRAQVPRGRSKPQLTHGIYSSYWDLSTKLFYAPDPRNQPLGTLAEFRETIRRERVTYIVRAPNRGFSEAPFLDSMILELVKSAPDAIRLGAQGRDARFQIYHIERPL